MKKSNHANLYYLLSITLILLLTACSSKQNGAAQAVESYIQALSNKDQVKLSNLSCSDWEADAMLEMDSFSAVGSKVENLACEQTGQEGSNIYISCTGVMTLDYNGEAQRIDLSIRTYIARQEDGEWRMCGYH